MLKLKDNKDFAGFTGGNSKGGVYPKIQSARAFWVFNLYFLGACLLLFALCLITA